MRNLGMAAVAAALLVGSAQLVRAQSVDNSHPPLHPRVTHREARELRADKREIHHDTREASRRQPVKFGRIVASCGRTRERSADDPRARSAVRISASDAGTSET
jgi:hypothetical protein